MRKLRLNGEDCLYNNIIDVFPDAYSSALHRGISLSGRRLSHDPLQAIRQFQFVLVVAVIVILFVETVISQVHVGVLRSL